MYKSKASNQSEDVGWNLVRKASWFPSWGGEINRASGFPSAYLEHHSSDVILGKPCPSLSYRPPTHNHHMHRIIKIGKAMKPDHAPTTNISLRSHISYYPARRSWHTVAESLLPDSSADFYFCPNPLIKLRESYFLQYFWSISVI